MKEILIKYKGVLIFLGLILAVGLSYKFGQTESSSVWDQKNKKQLSLIEEADSLSPRAVELTETLFSDELAQKAFNQGQSDDKPSEHQNDASKTPEKSESDTREKEENSSYSGDSEFSSRADELLGGEPEKQDEKNEFEEDTERGVHKVSGDSNKVLVSAGSKSSQKSGNKQIRSIPTPPSSKRTYGTTPDPSSLFASMEDTNVKGAVSGSDIQVVGNAEVNRVRGSLLKKGSEYLAVIEDTIELSPSMTQNVVVKVFGRLSQHTVTRPFQMFATAKLAPNGRSIIIDVNSCLDSRPDTKSIACKGDIGGMDGKRGLSDEVYSTGMITAIIRTLGAAASQWSLSKITESVTQSGILADQTQSNALWQTLSGSWQTLANETAKNIEKTGDTVTLYGQKVVKVLIIEDTQLW